MTDDFLARLRADAERVPPVEVSPDRVFDHLARRRRRRLAAVGTTSALALVLGLAVVQPWAGEREVALDPRDPWPGGVLEPGLTFQCGEPVPDIGEPDDEVLLHLESSLEGSWATVQEPTGSTLHGSSGTQVLDLSGAVMDNRRGWGVRIDLVNGSDEMFTGGYSRYIPGVWLVQAGVVVGVLEPVQGAMMIYPEALTLAPGERFEGGPGGPFVDCARDRDRPIQPGEYEVYVVKQVLTTPEPSEYVPGGPSPRADPLYTLVGGPYPVTITDGTEDRDAVEAERPGGVVPSEGSFVCGSPMPVVESFPGNMPLRLDAAIARGEDVFDLMGDTDPDGMVIDAMQPLAGATLDIGRRFQVEAAIVNPSPLTVAAGDWGGQELPHIWFVQDGQVVGYLAQDFLWGAAGLTDSGSGYVVWPPGAKLDRYFPHGEIRIECRGATVPPTPGEYDVYVTVDVHPTFGTPDGGDLMREVSRWVTLVGGPYPVTVEGEKRAEPAGWEVDQAMGRRPGLEDVRLGFDGFAALRLGSEVPAEPSGGDMIVWYGEYCTGAEDPGRWVSGYSEYALGEPAFRVRVQDDRVVRIELTSMLDTDRGIMVGSRLADVQAAYPGLALLRAAGPDWPVDSWAVTEDGRTMVFDIAPTDTGPDGESWREGAVVGIALVEGTDYPHPTTTGLCD